MDREWSPIGENLEIILKKMFENSQISYSLELVRTEDWYRMYQWTEKEENAFIDWLSDYLYNNKEARKEIMSLPKKNKKDCHLAAKQFSAFWGWQLKINNELTR